MKTNHQFWEICKLSKPQHRPYYVVRVILVDGSNTHYEQIRDVNGGVAMFETEAEAELAIETMLEHGEIDP